MKVTEIVISPEEFDTYFKNEGDVIENSEHFKKDICEVFTVKPRNL